MSSLDGEEKEAEQVTMTMDERKAKLEQLRTKMVSCPGCLVLVVHSTTAFIYKSQSCFTHRGIC
jgi:hypothetical protein